MDAFYASVEQRDHPEYRNKPVAVGYSGARGVVATASYEARKYGVRSAMPSVTARRKCPHLIFTPARFEIYRSISMQIRNIFFEFTDLVEPLSLDEAFLDVTVNHKNMSIATDIAIEIKKRIFKETGLTASAGVSYNKFLAKIASDYNKPNGLFIIKPSVSQRFIEQLPIERFFGVGHVTAERMHSMGIKNGYDLKQFSQTDLVLRFGKLGTMLYKNARGIDDRLVESNRLRKSVGAENTFLEDLTTKEEMIVELEETAEEVIRRINKHSFKGRTVTLKVKYNTFQTITRSKSFLLPVTNYETLYQTGVQLLEEVDLTTPVRLMGLTIKNNDSIDMNDAYQLELDFKD